MLVPISREEYHSNLTNRNLSNRGSKERGTILTEKETNIATILANLQTTSSGYDLLRYIGLPDMFGKETDFILYILGKNLARKSEWISTEELQEFFLHVGWGELFLVKEKRRGYIFELAGEIVRSRLETIQQIEFQIEAGFLADAMEQITKKDCECLPEIKKGQVFLHVMYMEKK